MVLATSESQVPQRIRSQGSVGNITYRTIWNFAEYLDLTSIPCSTRTVQALIMEKMPRPPLVLRRRFYGTCQRPVRFHRIGASRASLQRRSSRIHRSRPVPNQAEPEPKSGWLACSEQNGMPGMVSASTQNTSLGSTTKRQSLMPAEPRSMDHRSQTSEFRAGQSE